MPQVIDAVELMLRKIKLPTEAFFVDTNIVITFKDPFSYSGIDSSQAKQNETVTQAIRSFKSTGTIPYSGLATTLEYYKYVQVGCYKLFTGKEKFDPKDFKHLRDNDINFMQIWDTQIKEFRRVFTKTFPIFKFVSHPEEIESFTNTSIDFGDHLLISLVSSDKNIRTIFSNDFDLYLDDRDFFLLTTNSKIVAQAKSDDKLWKNVQV
jgi:hypothetical protein